MVVVLWQELYRLLLVLLLAVLLLGVRWQLLAVCRPSRCQQAVLCRLLSGGPLAGPSSCSHSWVKTLTCCWPGQHLQAAAAGAWQVLSAAVRQQRLFLGGLRSSSSSSQQLCWLLSLGWTLQGSWCRAVYCCHTLQQGQQQKGWLAQAFS